MRRISLLVGLVFFCSLSSLIAQSDYSVSSIPLELRDQANSVVRENSVMISIPAQDEIVYTKHRAITVLNKGGNEHVDAYVGYDDGRRVRKLQATVYNAAGREVEKFKKGDFEDVSAVEGGTLYSDNRVKYLSYNPTDYPYTIVIDYEVVSDNTAFIPPWYQYSNYRSSIQSTSLTIKYEPSLGLRHKLFDPNGALNISDAPGTFSIVCENLSAIKPEPYGPPIYEMMPNVIFATDKFHLEGLDGSATNWTELGIWEYENLIKGLDVLPKETIDKVQQLLADAETNKEKVRRIYEFVQNNTRYISVQLGIGGLRPYPASEVDQLGYGDCKGLTNYTKALLKSQGIESFYTEVWAGRTPRNIEADFASIQGNHVILNVPLEDEELWLECTSQTLPFNFLGDFTDDRDVIILTPEGGVLKRTPKYTATDNLLKTEAICSIDAEGSLTATVKLVSTGLQYDRRFDIETLSSDDKEIYYKEYWDYVDNIELQSVTNTNDRNNIVFTEEIELNATSYISKAGNKFFVPLNAFNRITSRPSIDRNRQQPLVFERDYTYEDSFAFTLDEGYSIEALPDASEVTSEFGEYTFSVEKISDNEVKYSRRLLLNKGEFPPTSYDDFRDFMRKLNRGDKQKMVIVKK